jgi:hypothetical protein
MGNHDSYSDLRTCLLPPGPARCGVRRTLFSSKPYDGATISVLAHLGERVDRIPRRHQRGRAG